MFDRVDLPWRGPVSLGVWYWCASFLIPSCLLSRMTPKVSIQYEDCEFKNLLYFLIEDVTLS
jgi:hypothetical protein